MLATYVSALNRCPYCAGSHAAFLRTEDPDPALHELARPRGPRRRAAESRRAWPARLRRDRHPARLPDHRRRRGDLRELGLDRPADRRGGLHHRPLRLLQPRRQRLRARRSRLPPPDADTSRTPVPAQRRTCIRALASGPRRPCRPGHLRQPRTRPPAGPMRSGRADLPGVVDVSLAYATAAVHADPDRVDDWDAWTDRSAALAATEADRPAGRLFRIPVWYGGDDLEPSPGRSASTEAEVIALHSGRDYRVFAVGFQPGFPYAGYLPAPLSRRARRSQPADAGARRFGGDRRPADGDLSRGIARRLAPPGTDPVPDRRPGGGVFPIEPGDFSASSRSTGPSSTGSPPSRAWPREQVPRRIQTDLS